MCGIAGIVSTDHRELGPLLEEMLYAMQHRGPDGAGYVIGDSCERQDELESLTFDGKKGNVALGHVRLAITGGLSGLQPFQSSDGRISLLHNGEIYNHRELAEHLNGDPSLETGSDSEVLMGLLEERYDGDLDEAIQEVLPELDGVYALVVTDGETTVIVRDKIGVRQLYYYATGGIVAFASEKKPLFTLGGSQVQVQRLSPGSMMIICRDTHQVRSFWEPGEIESDSHINNRQSALQRYHSTIVEAVEKRVAGKERVGIIFSGGVDSVLIAYLVKRLCVPFTCYTTGCGEEAPDIRWARRTARRLRFPLQVKVLSLEEIDHLIPDVINDIEDQSLNQVEVAIPIHASIRMAQEAGERVILTGQGADELFGGYPWYATIVEEEGYPEFLQRSWEDTFLLYKECLEREDKIAMAHSLELRVPFLDPEVVRIAFQIAPQFKIQPDGDPLGKRVHREYCHTLGIPTDIAYRQKEAAQHGANVHDALIDLAKQNGITASVLDEVGYDPDKTVQEKLGSSSRYGFRYGEEDLWKPLPHVQYYLDSHAARLGFFSRLAHYHWDETRRKLDELGLETP